MKRAFRKYFIPHEENNYKPHFLHTKRTLFYGATFLFMKVIVVGFALLLPATAFVMPDVLASEEIKLAGLVNEFRAENNIVPLSGQVKLYGTATDKALDMVTGQYFGHVSPSGRTLADIMEKHDYKYQFAGENLALGFADSSELLAAWIESPTHRANLLDPDFSEYGITMAAGNYEGEPTVFAVNHFGKPLDSAPKLQVKAVLPEKIETQNTMALLELAQVPTTKSSPVSNLLASSTTNEIPPVLTASSSSVLSDEFVPTNTPAIMWPDNQNILATYDREKSFVSVARNNIGQVTVSARVFMGVNPESARIEFGAYDIPLTYDGSDGAMAGELKLSADQGKISVLTSPILFITDSRGEVFKDAIVLRGQALSSVTPLQKYIVARKTLGDLMPVFKFSREVYLGFMALFACALALNVFVEIKRQHPHIILQTSGLLVLLFFLWAI